MDMDRQSLKCIFVACLMKLCTKLVEKQFTTLDPQHFYLKNVTSRPEGNYETKCYFDHSIQTDSTQSSVSTWIYTARYIFPVLGALLSTAWLGYIRVLQIGGVIMFLSTVLMSVSVYLGLMCQPSSPIIPITWLLLPLFYGLTQSSIVYSMFRWYRLQKQCTIVSALYYTTAASGEWISLLTSKLGGANALGNNFTLVFIVISVLLIALSCYLPMDSEEEPFEMPTQSRMIRYFQIFSGTVPFLISVSGIRSTIYMSEINSYMNVTNYFEDHPWMSPNWIMFLSLIINSLLLMLIVSVSPRKLPVQSRMLAGILLEAAVETCLMIFSIVGFPDATATLVIYSVASVFDGIAQILVMVAAYDLGSGISPSNSMCIVMGIMFTSWGLSDLGSRLLLLILNTYPRDNPVLHPNTGEKPLFYVFHLTAIVALVVSFLYNKFMALPLAQQLTPTDDQHESEPDTELRPLLSQEMA